MFSGIFVEVDRMFKSAGIKTSTQKVLAVALQVYTRRAQKGRLEFSKYSVDFEQPSNNKGYPYKDITIDPKKVSRIKADTLLKNIEMWFQEKNSLANPT